MSEEIYTNKLSIYLIKEDYHDHEDILKDHSELTKEEIEGIGTFYFGESYTYKPSWIRKFFGEALGDDLKLFSASVKAILLTEIQIDSNKKRVFAVPFGYGRLLLNPGVFEERFGLKVTLNTVDPNRLRRIDKKNMLAIPKDTIEQLSQAGVVADFGIDIEQDLVQAITGKSKDERFGKTITGKTALNISTKADQSNIKDFLKICYEKYVSDDYKQDFGWIDQIAEIKDPTLVGDLNDKLIENIRNNQLEKTWMAVPEIIHWADISGFTYEDSVQGDTRDDICLPDFLDSLPESIGKTVLDLDTLKDKKVYSLTTTNDEIKHQWKAYDCLYCEISDEQDNKTYLLNSGKWYEVENEFANQVDSGFKQLVRTRDTLKLPSYKHKDEDDYNEDIAKNDSEICCMHGDNISYGGGRSKIEFCDLFTKNKKIVHVKKYGASSVVSYLFNQGIVSGEVFLADTNFRSKVNDKLPETHKIDDLITMPNAAEYEIVFGIISSSPNELEIPFFSKVCLRNTERRLKTFGYKVSLQKIEINN